MEKRKGSTSSPNTTDEYARFVRNLQLIAIGLDGASSRLERSVYVRMRSKKDGAKRQITAEYQIAKLEDDHFDLTANFVVSMTDKESGATPLSIKCDFACHFHGKKPLKREFVNRFANAEFRLVVWPYFRQFVFDMSARMLISPITVPLSEEG